jgi:hypothetical protein
MLGSTFRYNLDALRFAASDGELPMSSLMEQQIDLQQQMIEHLTSALRSLGDVVTTLSEQVSELQEARPSLTELVETNSCNSLAHSVLVAAILGTLAREDGDLIQTTSARAMHLLDGAESDTGLLADEIDQIADWAAAISSEL